MTSEIGYLGYLERTFWELSVKPSKGQVSSIIGMQDMLKFKSGNTCLRVDHQKTYVQSEKHEVVGHIRSLKICEA